MTNVKIEKEARRVKTFGSAMRIFRIKAGLSCQQVGINIGVDKSLVKDWERQESTPSPLHLKKLYDLFPNLKYFTDFLPRIMKDQLNSRAMAAHNDGKRLWIPPSPTPADFPIPEDLVRVSFGRTLRIALMDEEISAEDLREVLDLGDASIIRLWERNEAVPDSKQYRTLLELFPQLIEAPRPGEEDQTMPPNLEPPMARIIPHPSAALPAEPIFAKSSLRKVTPTVQYVAPPIVTPAPAPPLPPVVTPAPAPAKKVRSQVDLAGIAHANALLALQHARMHLEDLRAQAAKVEAELVELEQDVAESEKDLLAAVKKMAEETQ